VQADSHEECTTVFTVPPSVCALFTKSKAAEISPPYDDNSTLTTLSFNKAFEIFVTKELIERGVMASPKRTVVSAWERRLREQRISQAIFFIRLFTIAPENLRSGCNYYHARLR
jgi:hypothetical protein